MIRHVVSGRDDMTKDDCQMDKLSPSSRFDEPSTGSASVQPSTTSPSNPGRSQDVPLSLQSMIQGVDLERSTKAPEGYGYVFGIRTFIDHTAFVEAKATH